jgi:hypothetical protein
MVPLGGSGTFRKRAGGGERKKLGHWRGMSSKGILKLQFESPSSSSLFPGHHEVSSFLCLM